MNSAIFLKRYRSFYIIWNWNCVNKTKIDCILFFGTQGMFMKPNPKAFPHAMKYLFTICDSIEFKKKFCWPIYDKAAEATFR